MLSRIFCTAAILGATAHAFVLPRADSVCGSTSSVSYTVVQGDTATAIAEKFNSGICDIASVNNLDNPNLIQTGQVLTIPVNCTDPDNTSCLSSAPASDPTETCVPGVGSTYYVIKGDTFSAIAKNFEITLGALEAANPEVSNPDAISVGQLLHVPICPNSACACIGTYTVVAGDIYYDLAMKYGTTAGSIASVNAGQDPTTLAIGQQIILPQQCKNITATA
ncbi:extracellular protein 6 [Clathrospora elynae]|uniref:Extracellular protein 6 n=1 Tax=Clathrospora elynae TaxID=706981 RepID=A0A6A5SAN5_9PLEO|nr:extracellular protein 6 [Clathrospora elynae]